jgi:PAS domain S-box-containing protein
MDAVITVDAGQRIVLFNASAEQMFGVRQADAMGTHVERLIPADVRHWHRRKVDEFGATGVTARGMGRLGMVRGLRADGSEFPAEASISQVLLGGERYYTVILRDITERQRAEAQVRDYAARLQRLSIRLLQVQERERRHLARELHDEIGQTLTAAKLRVQQFGEGPAVADTVGALDRVLQQVRALSLNLRPSMLDDLGLPATLRWYLNQQATLGGLEVGLEIDGLEARLDPEIETAAFRIVQEAMTNVLRHAAAKRVEVAVESDGSELRLRVIDDGLGFDVKARRTNFGLLGMKERAMLAGGRIEIDSAPGRGTALKAWLPCRTQAKKEDDHDD